MNTVRKRRNKGFRAYNGEAGASPWCQSRFVGKVLRVAFLLGFVVVLASCPMPDVVEPGPGVGGVEPGGVVEPGVPSANAGMEQMVGSGVPVTLDGSGSEPATVNTDATITYEWVQIKSDPAEPDVVLTNATSETATFTAPDLVLPMSRVTLTFRLTVTGSGDKDATADATVTVLPIADADGDGLIEISTLEMLHNMRYNLLGTSYKTSDDAVGESFGCPITNPVIEPCTGYELTTNLDFDTDGDGTWDNTTFALDSDDDNDIYFDVDAGGWDPIGAGENAFATNFEGNGYTISNLAVRRDQSQVGLFGTIGSHSVEGPPDVPKASFVTVANIRNIGLVNSLVVYTGGGVAGSSVRVGGLVALQRNAMTIISASYAAGVTATGGSSNGDTIGGLVGAQINGVIIGSYAKDVVANGGGASTGSGGDTIGGLVGAQQGGSIIASYSTGTATGTDDVADTIGGLTGTATATGITASYSTVTVVPGSGGDAVSEISLGGLVGQLPSGYAPVDSYGFGRASAHDGDAWPPDVTDPTGLTLANAGTANTWDLATSNTLGAWNFGTDMEVPVLKYADYDGSGTVYSCDIVAADGTTSLCDTIIPNQGR